MTSRLKALFREILEEANKNADFRQRIELALGMPRENSGDASTGKRRAKNRRDAALVNPYEAIKAGDDSLKEALQALSLDQLKDVVSQFSIDSTKLALKWKSRERLIDLIVLTTKGRLEKGDAFRSQTS